MRITPLALVGVVALAALATPAGATTKKPIIKTYTANAPAPDPSNYAMQSKYDVCAQNVPNSFDVHEFTTPGIGKLKVELTGFTGDWDLLLTDKAGNEITSSGGSDVGTPNTAASESLSAKMKKAKTTYRIIACNWAGGSTASVKYTFTYA